MKDQYFKEMLARLQALIIINDARVMTNPKFYLDEMYQRSVELLKVFDEIEYALSSNYVFDYWDCNFNKDIVPRPIDVQGEALIRCNKALEVIGEYRHGKSR